MVTGPPLHLLTMRRKKQSGFVTLGVSELAEISRPDRAQLSEDYAKLRKGVNT